MLKVALVALNGVHATSGHAEAGPLGQGVLDTAQALAAHGHRITVYARRDSPSQPAMVTLDSGVVIEYLRAGPATRLPADKLGQHLRQFADELAERWRRDRPDVAHAFFWTGGLAALAVTREQQVPVVQTFFSLGAAEHRYHLPDHGPAGRIRLEASIARTVATVLAASTEETADLAGLGVPQAAVRIVPWGVDTAQFTPDGPAMKRGRRQRVVAFGPLAPSQGLETVIRALAQVPEAELVVIGGPHRRQLRTQPYYRTLAGLAASAGIRQRVTFAGRVAEGDLPAWLRSADLVVSAAPYDPYGTATLQAMACGIPVIAPGVGASQDAVIDGTTGMLVPPDHPRLLAQRIRELLAAPVRRGAYGAAAADRARSRYSWERVSQETLTAYQHSAQLAG